MFSSTRHTKLGTSREVAMQKLSGCRPQHTIVTAVLENWEFGASAVARKQISLIPVTRMLYDVSLWSSSTRLSKECTAICSDSNIIYLGLLKLSGAGKDLLLSMCKRVLLLQRGVSSRQNDQMLMTFSFSSILGYNCSSYWFRVHIIQARVQTIQAWVYFLSQAWHPFQVWQEKHAGCKATRRVSCMADWRWKTFAWRRTRNWNATIYVQS